MEHCHNAESLRIYRRYGKGTHWTLRG